MCNLRYRSLIFLLPPPIFWGSNFVVGRALHGEIDPFPLNYWRWVIALLLLAPLGWRQLVAAWPVLCRCCGWTLCLSVLSVVAFNTLVYAALETLPAGEGALIHAATPFASMAVAALLLGERFGLRQIAGAVLSFAGAALVIGTGTFLWSDSAGGGLMLFTVVIWAFYSVLLKLRPPDLPPFALLLAVIAVGVIIQTPLYLLVGAPPGLLIDGSPEIFCGVVYLGAVASALAYWLWEKGVAAVGPAAACQFFHVVPLSAALLAWAGLGEALTLQQGAGASLVLLGITCTLWRTGAPQSVSPAPPQRRQRYRLPEDSAINGRLVGHRLMRF
jgi:drug/metabolite transporter (DMT)-like permease